MSKPGDATLDPSGLLVPVASFAHLNELEADNVAAAAERHLGSADAAPFDYSYLLQLHRDMFGAVWSWAGRLRRADLNIGVPWRRVETDLYELTLNVPYWAGPLAERAARLHHRLVQIHPFPNGNGRWSRLAADVYAVRHGGLPVVWPAELVGPASVIREQYLAAVRAADAGNLGPLVALHLRHTLVVTPPRSS